MSAKQPNSLPLLLRYWGIFLGITLLFWLPIEDTTETWALLFAIAISAWFAIAFFLSKRVKFRSRLVEYISSGTLAGILVTPIALLLMAIKTGLHAHEAPEYTSQQLISTVWKIPLWIVGGFLIGLGSGIWMIYRETASTIE